MGLVQKQYDNFVFGLKYRPRKIQDIVLPERLKILFQEMVDSKHIGNLLFSGQRGCGKTTVAFCLADQTGLDVMYMRMSNKTSIDNIRKEVTDFISSVSMNDGKKIFIGDEFERLSPQAMDALKTEIEVFTKNVNFIFITNHKHKVSDEMISRLDVIDFVFSKEERIAMKKQLFMSLANILKQENIKFEKNALIKLINMKFPDIRKIVNNTSLLARQNKNVITVEAVDRGIGINVDIDEFYKYISTNDFGEIRQMISDMTFDLSSFYSEIYNTMDKYIKPESIPAAVLLLAKYQYESAFSTDPQIPLCACCTELMTECQWIEIENV